jgi:hypothetical protein
MNNRPDPEMFARYSYYLAFASAFILLVAFLVSFLPAPISAILVNVVWLALITAIVGTFLGFAATRDFKRTPGSDQSMREARVGFRINLIAGTVMILIAVLAIIIRVITSSPVVVQ